MGAGEMTLSSGVAGDGDAQRRFRALIVLGLLTATVNILDRSVLNIVAEPVKRAFGLSDTQLGLLTGFAFALFYSLAGLPIARYVDRPSTHRPTVVAICVALWSALTMLCGAVTSYGQLLLARMLVAVGESGSGPALVTLIDDTAPRAARARAFAVYGLGVPLGTLLGLMLGGLLVDRVGWRLTFVFVGAPGLLLALCTRFFIHEPRASAPVPADAVAHPGLTDNFLSIARTPALFWLIAAASIGGLVVLGLPSWTGVYLIRTLGLSATHAGTMLGLILGIGGALGTFFGGALADRLARRDPGRALLVPALGLLIGIPAAIAAFSSDDWRVFTAWYSITVIGAAVYIGPLFSLLQLLVKENYRATTTAIFMMLLNLVGAGLGPLLVGLGSDALQPMMEIHSLRWALVGGHVAAIIPALCYLRAMRLTGQALGSASRQS